MVDFKKVVEYSKYIQDAGITAFDLLSFETLLELYQWHTTAEFTLSKFIIAEHISNALKLKAKHLNEYYETDVYTKTIKKF